MTSSADTAARWRPGGAIARGELTQARNEFVNLVQWLTRIADSYVPAADADERVTLTFRAADRLLITKSFEDGKALSIRLPDLAMQFLQDGKPVPHLFDPNEHSPAEVEAWLLVELLHRSVDRSKFSKALPYELPGLMSGDAEDHAPQSCREGLDYLAACFVNAAGVLSAVAAQSGAGKAELVCWPQTLDLSYRTDKGSMLAELGFSPGNAQSGEPHFYRRTAATNGAKPKGTRAILTVSEIEKQSDPAAAATAFLQGAKG